MEKEPQLHHEEEEHAVDPEREKEVSAIVETLEAGTWEDVLMRESFGGNAGPNRAGINFFADRETGEIIAFGNIQNIAEDIRNDERYAVGTFIFEMDMGSIAEQLRNGEEPDEEGRFVDVVNRGGLSDRAFENLRRAMEEYEKRSA